MCGRLDQRHAGIDYALAAGWKDTRKVFGENEAVPRVNAPPGTYRPVLHMTDGERVVEDRFWGYKPSWATKKTRIYGNARLDKLTGNYWRSLVVKGRCIVPADGWYEWTGPDGAKLPWHIHLKEREPIFMAGIASFIEFRGNKAEAGFAIVTADALGGMIDVHDRRPVVLTAADAQTWMEKEMPIDEAVHFLTVAGRPPEDFEWFRVSPAMNSSRAESPDLAEPID